VLGEGADVLQRTELELRDLDPGIAGRAAGDSLAFRHIASGDDDVRAQLGQHASGLLTEAAGPAGHQCELAAQVDAFRDLARRRLRSELRCVSHITSPLLGFAFVKLHYDTEAARLRRPLIKYTAARSSSSGSAEASIPSTLGIGSKMMCFCSRVSFATGATSSSLPSSTTDRESGQ